MTSVLTIPPINTQSTKLTKVSSNISLECPRQDKDNRSVLDKYKLKSDTLSLFITNNNPQNTLNSLEGFSKKFFSNPGEGDEDWVDYSLFEAERILCVWRLVRESLRLRDFQDAPLSVFYERANFDHETQEFDVPFSQLVKPDPIRNIKKVRVICPEYLKALHDAERLSDCYQIQETLPYNLRGFGHFPPTEISLPDPLAKQLGKERKLPPDEDPLLCQFILGLQALADNLNIYAGSPKNPHLGDYGLCGLLRPKVIREIWPKEIQLIVFEEMLVEEVLNLLINDGIQHTGQVLHERYGLTRAEVGTLSVMARSKALERTNIDQETARSMMVLRLEEFIKHARLIGDTRAEQNGIKQLTIIQGLNMGSRQNIMMDFLQTVKEMSLVEAQARFKDNKFSVDKMLTDGVEPSQPLLVEAVEQTKNNVPELPVK